MGTPVKISDLPAASAAAAADVVPGVQSGSTVKFTFTQIGAFVRALFTTTPATIAEGGTGAATAAGARTNLDVPSNAEAILDSLLTTTGDSIEASAASTPARMPAVANVAANATTSNPWVARVVVLTGTAVTFTDIADAPYAGAVVWVKQNAAHVWTDGATFVVQGDANYTAADGDWIRIYATTVSTFEITIFKANGQSAISSTGTSASTFTFNGSGGTSGSVTMTYQKIGNWVTLHIPAVTATSGTGSTGFTNDTVLPAALRPAAATQVIATNNDLDNGGSTSTPSAVLIATSGVVTILRSPAAQAWTNSSVCGTVYGMTITYFVG